MNLTLIFNQFSWAILVLFAVGCALSWVHESRRNQGRKPIRLLRFVEWILLIPGFALIFIFLQEKGVLFLVSQTGLAIGVLLVAVAVSVLLIVLKRKKPSPTASVLAGLVGTPLLIFTLILLGQFVLFQDRFAGLKTTYSKLVSTEGVSAPDFGFALVGSDGTGRLHDYRGKVVLVNFWATWCAPCLVEMPALNRLQQEYQSQGLLVINISDESEDIIGRFLEKNPMVTVHGRISKQAEVPEFYQFGKSRPTTFVLDRQGVVVETCIGKKSYSHFEGIINLYL